MPYVTDTHSLVWYMTDDPKLSEQAKKAFQKVDNFQDTIFIPCIVFFELVYLIEKRKITADFDIFFRLVSSAKNYKIEPLCLPIIDKSRQISKESIADPWDRLIVATSLHLNLPLITRDMSIRKLGLKIVW
ncbi:MAG: type II toxin-antitoxin system VapC family toxin [Nitrospinae bacterium]|nr:type II toxin-antitoxin system VapC family toxin [Nitrospinota bacterium]